MENTYRKWQELQEERTSDLTQAHNRQKRIIAEQNIMQKFLHKRVTTRLEGFYLNWNILMEVVERVAQEYGDAITLEIRNNKPRVTIKGKGIPFIAYRPDDDNTTPIELLYTSLLKIIEMKRYPFNEGDDYWSIVDGDVVHSCWDDVSEEIYDDNPHRKLFDTQEQAEQQNQGKKCSKCNRTNLKCYCDMD